MLCEETQTDDIVLSNESEVLPVLEIQKNLQILFSNETSQVLMFVYGVQTIQNLNRVHSMIHNFPI